MLFEGRNKSYGAYTIRKNYSRNVFIALCLTTISFLALTIWPVISGYLSARFDERKKITEVINLEEPPPIDKSAPPPEYVEPPPLRQTLKFTAPIIVTNPDTDEVPPTQAEVKFIQVSTITQEGSEIAELPPDPSLEVADNSVFTLVEEMPSFPGGDLKLLQMLSRIHYPRSARENGVAGAVFLTFIVDKEGKIKDAKVLKGIGGGCDEEALRVLLALPDWSPGRQNGRPVSVRSTVRVNFALN